MKLKEKRQAIHKIKTDSGCVVCGYNRSPYALQFDHVELGTKYRTRAGNLLEPSDMVARNYSWATILEEIAKCRIICANCHAEHTHTSQR